MSSSRQESEYDEALKGAVKDELVATILTEYPVTQDSFYINMAEGLEFFEIKFYHEDHVDEWPGSEELRKMTAQNLHDVNIVNSRGGNFSVHITVESE
jgi:hypothetical protein